MAAKKKAKTKTKSAKTTTCKKCGKVVEYKTKKPLYCKEHAPASIYNKPKTQIPQRSKLEFQAQLWIAMLFPDKPFILNGYYSWILSPKGYPMQLDIFVYGKGTHFAIEIDGLQHEQKQYFQTQEEFNYLQKCDKLKEEILEKKGIRLFKVPYTCLSLEEFKWIIREVL